jgi:hypothetical protein
MNMGFINARERIGERLAGDVYETRFLDLRLEPATLCKACGV